MRLFIPLAILALVILAFTGSNVWAFNEANCNACVGSYHCEGYLEGCAKDCNAKHPPGDAGREACEASCGSAASTCKTKATKDCDDYCKK